jgi:hypothetical protein
MKSKTRSAFFATFCLLAMSSLACTFSLLQLPTIPAITTQLPTAAVPTATPLPKAQTIFNVTLPAQ